MYTLRGSCKTSLPYIYPCSIMLIIRIYINSLQYRPVHLLFYICNGSVHDNYGYLRGLSN